MEIEVRLFAGLRTGRFKKQVLQVPDDSRLGDILHRLDIPEDNVSLPLVNGQYSELDHSLQTGDVLSLFPAVGGG